MTRIRSLPAIPLCIGVLTAPGCATAVPFTLGDPRSAPAYGYTPLDPIPVEIEDPLDRAALFKALPNETTRIAIGEITASGNVEYGLARVGVEGRSYEVVVDYIKFTTETFAASVSTDTGTRIATLAPTDGQADPASRPDARVPVYIGVGLRMTASITVHEGTVDLGNLFAIGAAAQARRASGTLVIQTLGVSGSNITPLLPMPGKIDDTTIQNAMVALGSIKSKLYEDGTDVVPRVLGVYNTLGGGEETINSFISVLFERPLRLDVRKRQVTRGGA